MIPSCARSSNRSQFWRPNTRTGGVPLEGASARCSCVRRRTRTDFPAPFGPMTAVCSPWPILRVRLSSTRRPSLTTVASDSSSTGAQADIDPIVATSVLECVMKSSFVIFCAGRVFLGVKSMYQAVQHGCGENRERRDERQAGIECEEPGEELSSHALDVANRSHPAEQHRGIQKRVDPLLIRQEVKAQHADDN